MPKDVAFASLRFYEQLGQILLGLLSKEFYCKKSLENEPMGQIGSSFL